MDKGINLTKETQGKSAVLLAVKKSFDSFAYFILGLFVLVVVLTTAAFLFYSSVFQKNEAMIISLETQIKDQAKKESYLITVANRLGLANDILKQKKSYLKNMLLLQKLFFPGLTISNFEINGVDAIKITGEVPNSKILADFNTFLTKTVAEEGYKEAVYSSFSLAEGGKYNFVLEIKK